MIEEQMLDTAEPMPNGVVPFARIILCDRCWHSRENSAQLIKAAFERHSLIGTPPIVAADQAVTCDSPCTPNTKASIDFAAT